MKIDKKSYPQVYLKQCKYKIKKKKTENSVDVKLDLDSDDLDDSNPELLHYVF